MSTLFDRHLKAIADRITIRDEDRWSYTQDFDAIRDYVFDIMRQYDKNFNLVCKGASLFGSYSNNVRICYPNEFDVNIIISFPFSSYINIEEDKDRPGFVKLNFFDVIQQLEDVNGYDDFYELLTDNLVDYNNYYLRRSNLQRWIFGILKGALDIYGYNVRGATGILYKLEYSKRNVAHTIYARGHTRGGVIHNISIDFVPAVMFGEAEWMTIPNNHPFINKCVRWFAVPKTTNGPKNSRRYAFMICCPKAEHDLLLGKQNLKVVFRLLKSLCKEYGLRRIKSYFITTIFLWEIQKQSDDEDFWYQDLSVLFTHMLDVLSDYFLSGYLPFFWNSNLNLLDALYDEEIDDYTDKLCKAYDVLSSYSQQPKLTYERTLTHFEIPEGR